MRKKTVNENNNSIKIEKVKAQDTINSNKSKMLTVFERNLKIVSRNFNWKRKLGDVGTKKYLPSFSKEWRNSVYYYNNNNIRNLPVDNLNINKIIKMYFNLYFKTIKGFNPSQWLKKRRKKFLDKIYVSNVEIKYTNYKALINVYLYNIERYSLNYLYFKNMLSLNENILEYFFYLYSDYILLWSGARGLNVSVYEKNLFLASGHKSKILKKDFLKFKINNFKKFDHKIQLIRIMIWTTIIHKSCLSFKNNWLRYNLLYNLNIFKSKYKNDLLPKLTASISKILGKKIQYNLINLKSIVYNTDIFTYALALQVRKNSTSYQSNMFYFFNKADFPVGDLKNKNIVTKTKDLFLSKFKNLNIKDNINNNRNIDQLLANNEPIFDNFSIKENIFNSINYKNLGGIKIRLKGRLTPRYRADRSVQTLMIKGGLKNINSSYRGISNVLFRGNKNSNTSYSMFASKRRIGAFAVKGWISGV